MMRNIQARLETLERRAEPDSMPLVVLTSHDDAERWASILSMNSEATANAESTRAQLTAQGYQVRAGYGRGA